MNDTAPPNDLDHDLRRLARALAQDAPEPAPIGDEGEVRYVPRHPDATGPARRVLVGAAIALVLVLVGGTALTRNRASGPTPIDAGSGPLDPHTSVPDPLDPVAPLLVDRYQLRRSSWDDASQSTLVPVRPDEIPAGVIPAGQAIASASSYGASCPEGLAVPPCDPPFTAARLGHFQGFAGYTSAPAVTVLDPDEPRRDAIVWVVVRSDDDFSTVRTGPRVLTTALLIDAVTGELVSGGDLLPTP